MLTYTKNTLFGLVGLSLVSLAALPAQADGWKKNHHRHGHKVVKVVKKVTYVETRKSRRHHRAKRRQERRWRIRNDRRWNNYHHRPRVVHHHTRVIHHAPVVRQRTYHRSNRTVAGSVIGAVIGGLTGNAIGRGRGRAPAIIAGGVLGAIIGGSIGESMDKADHVHTNNALENARTGQRVTWKNPDTGADYTVTPTRTYQRENGQYCRDFKTWGWIDGYEEELHGTACRASDGTWRKVS
jgi:surface antigen